MAKKDLTEETKTEEKAYTKKVFKTKAPNKKK